MGNEVQEQERRCSIGMGRKMAPVLIAIMKMESGTATEEAIEMAGMSATESTQSSMTVTGRSHTPQVSILSCMRDHMEASSKGSDNTSASGKDNELNAEVQRRPVHPRVGGCLRWAIL